MGAWMDHKPAWLRWTPATFYLLPFACFLLAGLVGLLWHEGMGKLLTMFGFGMYTMNVVWIRWIASPHDATSNEPHDAAE